MRFAIKISAQTLENIAMLAYVSLLIVLALTIEHPECMEIPIEQNTFKLKSHHKPISRNTRFTMSHGITDQSETSLDSIRKISILHPCSLVLLAIRDIVAKMSAIASIHQVASLASIRDIVHPRQVALVILGESLLEMPIQESIMFVSSLMPNVKIAVLTTSSASDRNLSNLGVSTIPTHQPYEAVTHTIRDLLDACGLPNQSAFNRFHSAKSGHDAIKSLSSRQLEILKLLTMGLNNQEIAREQNVSTETIKTHLHDIYQKLEVKNRTQAALLYLSNAG